MKAKEYIAKYQPLIGLSSKRTDDEKMNSITDLLEELLRELNTIVAQRKVSTDAGALAIIRELRRKWEAMYRELNLPESLFELSYKGLSPELYEILVRKGVFKGVPDA